MQGLISYGLTLRNVNSFLTLFVFEISGQRVLYFLQHFFTKRKNIALLS